MRCVLQLEKNIVFATVAQGNFSKIQYVSNKESNLYAKIFSKNS